MPVHPDYGYPWWLTYGHLVVTIVTAPLWVIGLKRRWPRVLLVLIGAVTLWSVAAFLVARFALNVNGSLRLPTEHFVESGTGRVLDVGAGTGRSTVMVLDARPHVTASGPRGALGSFPDRYPSPPTSLMPDSHRDVIPQRASLP